MRIFKIQKLPIKVKTFLEKGKLIIKELNEKNEISNLNTFIYDCINIENNIKDISYINEKTKKILSSNLKICFYPYKEDKINNIKDILKNFGEIKKIYSFNSFIKFDEKLVFSWFSQNKIKPELLYRKTRDGSKPENFHNKCDKKGKTITFIETTKGYIFGGYTETEWDCTNRYKKDKSTFY